MSSKNGYISCAHIEQFKENKNGLKMYKFVYSSLIAICNQDARKQKVRCDPFDRSQSLKFEIFKNFSRSKGAEHDVLHVQPVQRKSPRLPGVHLPGLLRTEAHPGACTEEKTHFR